MKLDKKNSKMPVFSEQQFFVLGILAWSLAIVLYLVLLKYESYHEPAGTTPANWPAPSQIGRKEGKYTLIFFAHPNCPCTVASMNELAKIASKTNMDLSVYFEDIPGQRVECSRLWKRAQNIHGLALHKDSGNAEARRFGANSSGYTIVYDPQGKLVFAGGITSGRAHEGDNRGANLILHLYKNEVIPIHSTPTYGCSLIDNPSPNGVLAKCIR